MASDDAFWLAMDPAGGRPRRDELVCARTLSPSRGPLQSPRSNRGQYRTAQPTRRIFLSRAHRYARRRLSRLGRRQRGRPAAAGRRAAGVAAARARGQRSTALRAGDLSPARRMRYPLGGDELPLVQRGDQPDRHPVPCRRHRRRGPGARLARSPLSPARPRGWWVYRSAATCCSSTWGSEASTCRSACARAAAISPPFDLALGRSAEPDPDPRLLHGPLS